MIPLISMFFEENKRNRVLWAFETSEDTFYVFEVDFFSSFQISSLLPAFFEGPIGLIICWFHY